MVITSIFGNPVAKFNNLKLAKKERERILSTVDYRNNVSNLTSIDTNVLSKSPKFKKSIEDSITKYVNDVYKPKNNIRFPITQSWLNITEKGMGHHHHVHPNSYFSGVFYLRTIPQDRIEFNDDNPFAAIFDPKEYNSFNSFMQWMEVKENDLLIFKSSMSHGVPTNKHDSIRLSLSFNTFISGEIGKENDLTRVKIGN
jgi:uncharacterized protein (TIGR02466 family)